MPHPLNALPNEFFLYIPTRTPTNSLVRLQSLTGDIYYNSKLTCLPFTGDLSYKVKFDKAKPESTPFGTYRLQGLDNSFTPKQFFAMKDIHVTTAEGVEVPVLRFTEPAKHIHGTTSLNRNFAISKFEGPPPAPAVASPAPILMFDASSNFIAPYNVNASAPVSDISGNAITHVTNPVISNALNANKKKIKPLTPAKPKGDLSPFVAKQLMELAQSRGEFCPILAEEFSAGHTAVMPCGHLFTQIAIEESFKKESHKCPACRQTGHPTYV
jgi:hypothetical protein